MNIYQKFTLENNIDSVDVVYNTNPNGWYVKAFDNNFKQKNASLVCKTQREAIEEAKKYGVRIFVFKKNGTLKEVLKVEDII